MVNIAERSFFPTDLLFRNFFETDTAFRSFVDTKPNYPVDIRQSSEALRIDSSGRLLLGTTTEGHAAADDFTIENTAADMGMTIRSGTSSQGAIYFSDGTTGDAEYRGILNYNHANDALSVYTSATERLRITSDGDLSLRQSTQNEFRGLLANSTAINLTLGSTTSTETRMFI